MDKEQPSNSRSIFSAVWSGLTTGISLLVVAIAILIVGVPAAVGGMPLTVLSESMKPTYALGDLVVIKAKDPQDIRLGEVITYQVSLGQSELVTHRVIEKNSAMDGTYSFITQGDANGVPDATPIRDVQIHGTVWYRIPLLGWVNNWFTGQARQTVIPVVAGLLLLYALWSFVSGVREHKRKKFQGEAPQLGKSTPVMASA